MTTEGFHEQLQSLITEFRKVDKGNGVIDVACLHSVLRSSMSAEELLGLIVNSGACYVHYEEFLKWLETGCICRGLESAKVKSGQFVAVDTLTETDELRSELSYSRHSSHAASLLGPAHCRFWSCIADMGSLPPKSEKHRLMLTGATGLLGREVLKCFRKNEKWVVCATGLSRARAKDKILQLDLFDTGEFCKWLDHFEPDVLIHCVAERQPDKIEGNETWARKINCDLIRSIGHECALRKIWIVHMSTNYVFDGKMAPYAEDAKPSPMNTYGISKLEGEIALAEVHPTAAILRVPLLYGPTTTLAESTVTQLLNTVRKPSPQVCNWQERYPTYTPDLAQVIHSFTSKHIKLREDESSSAMFRGVFHWQAKEMYTKYGMAKVIADVAGVDSTVLIPLDAPAPGSAPRPRYEQLSCSRIDGLLGVSREPAKPEPYFTGFKASLEHVLKRFMVVSEASHEIY